MKISAFAIVNKAQPRIDTKEIYSASEIREVVVDTDEKIIKVRISTID